MCRWGKGSIAGLSYLRAFISCQKLNLIYFHFKKPKFRIFPAESEFVAVKSATQNLCFCNTVLKVGANTNAVVLF